MINLTGDLYTMVFFWFFPMFLTRLPTPERSCRLRKPSNITMKQHVPTAAQPPRPLSKAELQKSNISAISRKVPAFRPLNSRSCMNKVQKPIWHSTFSWFVNCSSLFWLLIIPPWCILPSPNPWKEFLQLEHPQVAGTAASLAPNTCAAASAAVRRSCPAPPEFMVGLFFFSEFLYFHRCFFSRTPYAFTPKKIHL